MTHRPILFLLDCLAVYRLTRLLTVDTITLPLRVRLVGTTYSNQRNLDGTRMRMAARPWLADLFSCPWCLSVWLGVPVVALQALLPAVCLLVSAVLAFSAVTGLLSEHS